MSRFPEDLKYSEEHEWVRAGNLLRGGSDPRYPEGRAAVLPQP